MPEGGNTSNAPECRSYWEYIDKEISKWKEYFMEKVLLVCNYFAPDNTIAAIRLSKFAKYLMEYGIKVDCITEKKKIIQRINC